MSHTVVDTGPLVALVNRRDRHHEWARETFSKIQPPLLTCEAVLSEACFLLQRVTGGSDALLTLLSADVLRVSFSLAAELDAVQRLMRHYASVPMSLADACLVRMTELESRSTLVTIDRDFAVYRRNRRQQIPTIMPTTR